MSGIDVDVEVTEVVVHDIIARELPAVPRPPRQPVGATVSRSQIWTSHGQGSRSATRTGRWNAPIMVPSAVQVAKQDVGSTLVHHVPQSECCRSGDASDAALRPARHHIRGPPPVACEMIGR